MHASSQQGSMAYVMLKYNLGHPYFAAANRDVCLCFSVPSAVSHLIPQLYGPGRERVGGGPGADRATPGRTPRRGAASRAGSRDATEPGRWSTHNVRGWASTIGRSRDATEPGRWSTPPRTTTGSERPTCHHLAAPRPLRRRADSKYDHMLSAVA